MATPRPPHRDGSQQTLSGLCHFKVGANVRGCVVLRRETAFHDTKAAKAFGLEVPAKLLTFADDAMPPMT